MNTITWKNRALSVVLTVIMVLSMLPLSVFAAGSAVADVDGTTYTDLIAAFDAAQEKTSATVKLLADVATNGRTSSTHGVNGIGDYIFEQGNVTFDLNGHTLTWTRYDVYDSSLLVGENGRLTIRDGGTGGKIYNEETQTINIYAGTLTIQSGTLMSDSDKALRIDGGAVSITGGTIHSDSYYGEGVWVNPDTVNNKTATLTVSGDAKLIGGTNGSGLSVYRKSDENPVVKLSGGTYTGGSNGIECNSTTVGTLLDEGCRYMLGGSEVTDTGVSALGSGVTVEANPNAPVKYIDADGNEAQANCAEITAETYELPNGWYVVKENVEVKGLNITNEVNLILCDGTTLTVTEYLNVTENSTLNLYWQSAGSGKLTAKAVGMMGSVNAPAGGMKQTADASGTTFEKCLVHEYEYTQNSDDTHTATCKLCGKVEDAESHRYENWTSADEKTHIGTCVCGTESTVDHEFVYHISADKKSHYGECGVCNYTSAEELHDADGTDGSCSVCGADKDIAVEKVEVTITNPDGTVTSTKYTDLIKAFYDADTSVATKVEVRLLQSGKTYTLNSAKAFPIEFRYTHDVEVIVDFNGCTLKRSVTDDTYGILSVEKGSVTFKNGTLELDDSTASAPAQAIKMPAGYSPELTLENMTVKVADIDTTAGGFRDEKGYAINAEGGTLNIKSGTYDKVAIQHTTARLSGGEYGRLQAENGTYASLLEKGYIFAFKGGTYIRPTTMGYISRDDTWQNCANIQVILCQHSGGFTGGVCNRCGAECEHTGGTASYFQKAKCTVCGAEYGELLTDTTPPTGRITVTERNWFESFLNTITFNLFFKEELTGKITATDDSYAQAGYDENKHAVKIEYIVSDKALTSAELTDWVQYDADKGIDLTGEQNYVVYAKLTDHAGNETLLSTDGLVIDKTAPSIGDFTDGQEVHICSGRYTVSVEDANLKEVTVDGVKQTGNSVTFSMAEFNNTHTVVAEDKAGNTSTVTFTLHGGHNYNIETGVCENGCGAAAEVRLTDGTGTRVWGKYDDARTDIIRSNTPVTLTLLKDCGDNDGGTTQFSKDGLDLTIDLNGHDFGNALDQLCVLSQTAGGSAKLNLIGEGSFKTEVWLSRGAILTVGEKVTYVGGIKIWYNSSFGDKVTDLSVALKGGKFGKIDLTYTDGNRDTQSVGTLGDLLVPGYVFKTDVASLSTASDVEVVPCSGHRWENGACVFCNLHCGHSIVINGECTDCHMTFVAMDDAGNYYSDLNAAFAGVADGGKLTLLADATGNASFNADKNVTLNMSGYKLSAGNTSIALLMLSGYLTVTDSMGEYIDISGRNYSIVMTGGTLKFEKKVKLGGRLNVTGRYDVGTGKYTSTGTLDGGLKEGSIITGGISVNTDDGLAVDLLPEGCAFAEYKADGTAGNIVRANDLQLDGNLIVVAHEHDNPITYDNINKGYYCSCGYRHFEHVYDKDGHCTLCDYVCSHNWLSVGETEDGRWICGECGVEIAARVTAGGTRSCYTTFADAMQAANAATGSATVTLLRSEHLTSSLRVTNASGVMLDLNGYALSGQTLNVGGMDAYGNDIPGKLTVTDSSDGNGSIGLEVKDGGTLVFDPGNNKTSILQLTVWGGDVKLYGGRIRGKDKTFLQLNNGVKMTDLLPEDYAFGLYLGDKTSPNEYISYDKAGKNDMSQWLSAYDLTPVKCEHEGLPSNFSGTNCSYCNGEIAATLTNKDGKVNGYAMLTDAIKAAKNGGTVKVLADVTVTEGLQISGSCAITLDLNGKTLHGSGDSATLTVFGANVTVKNGTVEAENGYAIHVMGTLTLADVTAKSAGDLAVYVASDKLTVNGGTYQGMSISEYASSAALNSGIFTLLNESWVSISVLGGKYANVAELLAAGHAFAKYDKTTGATGEIVNGYVEYLDEDVIIVEHTHSHVWDTTTHELVCACGDVKETDTTAPTISGIADGKTYYQNTLTFTAEDNGSGLASVKDGDKVLIRNASGEYTINADNAEHTITATDNAGNTAVVTVKVYRVYRVTLVSGTGYTVTPVTDATTVGHGQDYDFRVDIKPGYSKTASYQILVNGVADDKLSGLGDTDFDTCTYFGAEGDLTVTVKGVADITAPDAEIEIGENSFKQFLNIFTFGLFFKETQTVTVSATDAGSGVDKVEYLLSVGALDKDNLPTDGWKNISLNNGKGSFSIEPNTKGSVYVRVTDKDGNVALINSNGVVVYTDSTADAERISFTRLSDEDVSFKVNLNGNWFDRLLINDGKTTSSINGIVSSDGTVTLKNEELRKLAVGEYTVTVVYRPMGENYVEAEGNEAPASTTVKLTVERAARTPEFSAPNAVYDGAAYDDLTITDKPDGTTVEYKTQGADDSTYTTDAPKNAGSYTVRISTPQDENYNAAVFTTAFTISPKKVTVNGVTSDSKTYDGNDEAAIIGTATPSDNYDGENLTVDTSNAKAVFDSKNVGTDKTVTFSGFKLTGSAKDNYELTAQPVSVTADITAKKVTIEGTNVRSTRGYDASTVAEITADGTLTDVCDGDELTVVRGKANYADKNVGTGKTVSFTEFALDGADKGNYVLKEQPASVTADITVKEVTIEGTSVTPTRVYDATTVVEITADGTLTDVCDGDELTIVRGKANYADKNVGTGKIVTFTEFAIDGADKDNYLLKAQPASVTADITVKEVTIEGTSVTPTRVYDATTVAEITADGTLTDVCDGDELTIVRGKANYADKNVGTGKIVTFTEFALDGADKDNYLLKEQPASVTADITAKELTVVDLKVKNKQYDGTDKAELDGTPTLKGVEDGDEVQLDCGIPTFATTDVGENIAINFTLFFLSGTDSGNYTLTQPTGITGNIVVWIADGSEYGVNSNDWINTDFTVTAKTGYQLSLDDTANGTWTDTLSASNETADGKLTFYVKNTATGAISAAVTEHYKIDKTAPTGTVKLDERTPFEEFLHKITFGLFFKDDVTVKLTASDEASGVKSREYYKSDKALTLEEVKALTDSDWTAADSFGITAEDMAQFVIYARITDNAGNITYLSSDGAEFDTTAPEIIGVENGETYYVTRRVAFDDANLESVTVNGEPVDKDAPFDLAGDKNAVYTVVATDKAGNVTTYTVTMKPISFITDAIKNITAENVKSSDADAIEAVAQKILDIAAESDEEVIGEEQWNKLTEAAANCKKLQTRIAAVAAEIDRLTETINGYDIDEVTSADKADMEALIADIDTLLDGDNLTDTERTALEALKETVKALLARIADAKNAAESDEITAVKDITEDNVTLDDKDTLETAKKALEDALDDFDGNYTEEERKSLNDRLDTVKAALDAIGNAEKAAEEIKKLPSADDVKLTDKDEIERISKIIDALTDNEKALLGEDALGKLKALNEKLTELADNAKKPTSPSTGDTSDLALWVALLFISGGVITGVTVAGKKKKQQGR